MAKTAHSLFGDVASKLGQPRLPQLPAINASAYNKVVSNSFLLKVVSRTNDSQLLVLMKSCGVSAGQYMHMSGSSSYSLPLIIALPQPRSMKKHSSTLCLCIPLRFPASKITSTIYLNCPHGERRPTLHSIQEVGSGAGISSTIDIDHIPSLLLSSRFHHRRMQQIGTSN